VCLDTGKKKCLASARNRFIITWWYCTKSGHNTDCAVPAVLLNEEFFAKIRKNNDSDTNRYVEL
jgi:hypothetical protein